MISDSRVGPVQRFDGNVFAFTVVWLDLDDIRELADDFATELRRKNRSKATIDGYMVQLAGAT